MEMKIFIQADDGPPRRGPFKMAMLAAPRRKQKWSVDPRNSSWSKDEAKFGQKMLEKMGWSRGKGLGKSEQGATEHVKVKVKNDTLGLGTTASHEDNWIAHQDDFNRILADLNSCHGQNGVSDSVVEPKQGFSLEEKSKSCKKRVHYMKFTKGKDLSGRSDTDLACIFGKRSRRSQENAEEEMTVEEETATPDPEVKTTINTVTSSLTMQEYFAQRMAGLRGSHQDGPPPTAADELSEDSLDPPEGRKTKLKKRKEGRGEKEGEEPVAWPETEECGSKGRKKGKRRRADREERGEVIPGDGVTTGGVERQDNPARPRRIVEERDEEAGTDYTDGIHRRKRIKMEEELLQVTEAKKSKKGKKKNRER